MEVAMSHLKSAKIDVLVANNMFDMGVNQLSKCCSFSYFVNAAELLWRMIKVQSANSPNRTYLQTNLRCLLKKSRKYIGIDFRR